MSKPAHGTAALVGTFDGVHRGHLFLIDHLKKAAAERVLSTRVYTFTRHPLATLAPEKAPAMLLPADEKIKRLKKAGIDEIKVDDFASIGHLTARQYIARLATEGVKLLMIGYDNRFGSDGLKKIDQFAEAASGTGVEIIQAPELSTTDGLKISSSTIREAINSGNITTANNMLGYNYHITGTVEHGKQLGRTIGFPTANLSPIERQQLLPPVGVYATNADTVKGIFPAMTNIGRRPTVDRPEAPVTIESHVIGLDDDLYDTPITLYFHQRLRPERRFASIDELRNQLEADRQAVIDLHRPSQ